MGDNIFTIELMDVTPQGLPRPRFNMKTRTSYQEKNHYRKELVTAMKYYLTLDSVGHKVAEEGRLLKVVIRLSPNRSDIDNVVKNILDALQDAGVIANDKDVWELDVRVNKDEKDYTYVAVKDYKEVY